MKVMIAVDDSRHAERAVRFVLRMRWPAGSRTLVASVLPDPPLPVSVEGPPLVPPDAAEGMHRLEQRTQHALEEVRAGGLSSEPRTLRGDPREALLELAERERVDLLALGSRGQNTLMRWMLGSVSSHAVTHAPCSVLVVRPPGRSGGSAEPAPARPFARQEGAMNIVIGVDDSVHSRAAVDFVRRMSWPEDTQAVVLSVAHPAAIAYAEAYAPATAPPSMPDDMVRRHEEIASVAERALQGAHLTTRAEVATGDPRLELVELAHRERADLVVVGSHGRTGIAKLLMGSVASYVATHAPCSVLVVKLPRR